MGRIYITTGVSYGNEQQTGQFYRDNCAEDYDGVVPATLTVVANTYYANSQGAANQMALDYIAAYGQQYANTNGTCTQAVFWNVLQVTTVQKNDCLEDYTGTFVEYTIPAHSYSAGTQLEANNLAIAALNAGKQAYANSNGTCTQTTFWNQEMSDTFTKDDCELGEVPTEVVYTVPAHTYSSSVSVEAANGLAQADIDAEGQDYANAQGTCNPGDSVPDTLVFTPVTNANRSFSYTSNLQTISGLGVGVSSPLSVVDGQYIKNGGTPSSTPTTVINGDTVNLIRLSSASYSTLASVAVTVGGVISYYNITTKASVGNEVQSQVFTRNNCGENEYGSEVTYLVTANSFQADTVGEANALALADIATYGQANANSIGNCVAETRYYNTERLEYFIRDNCAANYTGSAVVFTVPAGQFFTYTSVQDANDLADAYATANGQAYANANGTCTENLHWWNELYTQDFTRNNCDVDYHGSVVTYTVPANTHKSYSSQAAANAMAVAQATANGQTYANTNGICIEDESWANVEMSETFTKVCEEDETGTEVEYTVLAGTYSSYTSQEDADAQAAADILAYGQAYADTNGECIPNPNYGNVYKMQTFQKQGCGAGNTGSYVDYVVEANTHFAPTQLEADNLALAQISANGQNYANTNGICIADTTFTVITVDMYNDVNLDLCAYIDTAGVAESGVAAARNGLNFYPPESSAFPQNALILASDNISQPTLHRRFLFNIGRLMNMYPDATAIPTFTFKIRGRTQGSAGSRGGMWQREYPTSPMIMTGGSGTYIPTTSPTGGPPASSYTTSVIGGGDGTVGVGVGNVFLTFVYTRATNVVSVITA